MAALTVEQHVEGVLAGDPAVLARTITLLESSSPSRRADAQAVLAQLLPHSGGSLRVGITGVPGVGKSTFIDQLGLNLVEAGHKVAVLAVDPTSSRTGGSILGDKTRMERLSVSPGAFIRPSPAGATLGGVTRATRETVLVCEAAGFDVVLPTGRALDPQADPAGTAHRLTVLRNAGATAITATVAADSASHYCDQLAALRTIVDGIDGTIADR